jgi:Arc/MetJ family transcription regulator
MLYRTAVRIDDELLAELKALAALQHRTLNSVMEEAFRRMITAAKEQEQRPQVKLTTSGRPVTPIPPGRKSKRSSSRRTSNG